MIQTTWLVKTIILTNVSNTKIMFGRNLIILVLFSLSTRTEVDFELEAQKPEIHCNRSIHMRLGKDS